MRAERGEGIKTGRGDRACKASAIGTWWRDGGRTLERSLAVAVAAAAMTLVFATPSRAAFVLLFIVPVVTAVTMLEQREATVLVLVTAAAFMVAARRVESLRFDTAVIDLLVVGLLALGMGYYRERLAARETERRAALEEAGMLGGVAATLSSTLDRSQLLDRIAEQLATAVGVTRCMIFMLNGDRLEPVAGTGLVKSLDALAGRDVLVMSEENLKTLEEVYVIEPDDVPGGDALKEFGVVRALALPLLSQGTLLGVASLDEPGRAVQFDERQRRTGVTIAGFAALTLNNVMQVDEITRQRARLARQVQVQSDLLKVSEAVLGNLDVNIVFETIAEKLAVLVEYDALDVARIDDDREVLTIVFSHDKRDPVAAQAVTGLRLKLGEGLLGTVAQDDEPLLSNDVLADGRGVQVPGTPVEQQASIVVPLHSLGRVIGTLSLDRFGGARFDESEFAIVQLFATQAAIAVENALLYDAVQHRANTDSLTGIYNHGHFEGTIEREIKRSQRYSEVFSLVMLDLDHFKTVNDRFGHQAGDRALRDVARLLRDCCREADYAARYGGEEFVMVLPRTAREDAVRLAERLLVGVRAVVVKPGHDFRLTVSVGVADYPACGTEARDVIWAADTALLAAKRRGRDRAVYFGELDAAGHQALAGA
jgi:diguanylate cyclase (GGDEF)-like protein